MGPVARLILPVNPLLGHIVTQAAAVRLPGLSLTAWITAGFCIKLYACDRSLRITSVGCRLRIGGRAVFPVHLSQVVQELVSVRILRGDDFVAHEVTQGVGGSAPRRPQPLQARFVTGTAGWLIVSPSSTTARTSAVAATTQSSEMAAISSGTGRAAPTIGGASAASAMPRVQKKRSPTESSGHLGIAAGSGLLPPLHTCAARAGLGFASSRAKPRRRSTFAR
jgi:hypothetical protein